jgi:hypothetical protein
MKFYALTYVSFDKTKDFSHTLQSNLLTFSDKYDIIIATKQAQKEAIVRYLEQTLDKNKISIQETTQTCDLSITNTCISAGNLVHLLIVNVVEAIPRTTKEELIPGDFVTLTPEAVEAIQTMEDNLNYNELPSNFKLGKVIEVLKDNIKIMICAIKTSNPTYTDYMTNKYVVPKTFLKKVYL